MDATRLVTGASVWNAVTGQLGESVDSVKTRLAIIVDRRHQIAHEADLGPTDSTRQNHWPISREDVDDAAECFRRLGRGIAITVNAGPRFGGGNYCSPPSRCLKRPSRKARLRASGQAPPTCSGNSDDRRKERSPETRAPRSLELSSRSPCKADMPPASSTERPGSRTPNRMTHQAFQCMPACPA